MKLDISCGGSVIPGLLGVIFVTLKLLNVIDWSWWWVLAPFWIPLAIAVLFLIVWGIAFIIAAWLS